jgi:hypothetical protein
MHDLPVIMVEFELAELKGFVSCYVVDDDPILDSKS